MGCKPSKAITVWKSQGQTLEAVFYDPGKFAFAEAVTYVALSRLKDIKNLGLRRAIKMSDIKVNKEALEYLSHI